MSKKAPKQETSKEEDNRQLALRVFSLMYDGLSLRQACRRVGIPASNVVFWCNNDPELAEHYANAREGVQMHWAEDIVDIADEEVPITSTGGLDSAAVAKQRLRIDSRKWILSKLQPKKFGDKLEQTMLGPNGGPVQYQEVPIIVEGVKPT